MHRASPTLLIVAACLAGSLVTAAPAAADDSAATPDATPPVPLLSPAPTASDPAPEPATASPAAESPFGPAPSPFASSTPDVLLSVNVAMPAAIDSAPQRTVAQAPRTRLPLRTGQYGPRVTRLQERLAWLGYGISAGNRARQSFGASTAKAVRAFQAKNSIPVTGTVTRRTWRELRTLAEPVGIVPRRCTEVKTSLCIDKTTRTLRLVVKGEVALVTDARFGAPGMETDEGLFSVREKSYNHTSSIYGTWMPRALFFNGDEAVHYSPDFRAVGYLRGSHGCVGVRDMRVATELFDRVAVGTRVYVYRS